MGKGTATEAGVGGEPDWGGDGKEEKGKKEGGRGGAVQGERGEGEASQGRCRRRGARGVEAMVRRGAGEGEGELEVR